jgi:zinc transport system permease protein
MAIGFFTRSKRVHDDSAIGIFLVASMALGLLLIKLRVQYFPTPNMRTVNTEALLFGDFIAVDWVDSLLALATAIACFAVIGLLFHEFLYTTLDEEMARVNGVPTRMVNTLQLVLISLVIVVGVRMVGFLMITAMTIIPGATAAMISRRFGGVMAASLSVGVGGTLLALFAALNPLKLNALSALQKFPPGPILVLTLFAIFGVTWTIRQLFKPKLIEIPADNAEGGHEHRHTH